jgi:hypothetical protein
VERAIVELPATPHEATEDTPQLLSRRKLPPFDASPSVYGHVLLDPGVLPLNLVVRAIDVQRGRVVSSTTTFLRDGEPRFDLSFDDRSFDDPGQVRVQL